MNLNQNLLDELEHAWLGLTHQDIKSASFRNPLKKLDIENEYPGITPVALMRNPSYISYTCKTLINLDILPLQAVVLNEIWSKPFPMLIGSRGLSKSFMLALYAILRMSTTPMNSAGGAGVKIVIVGAGFRQAKQVFQYVEDLYGNSKILKSINGPSDNCILHENDRFSLKIGKNTCIAIPLGTGDKVRGLRANIVLADEFGAIDPNIFETVIQGFATVSAGNPLDVVRAKAKVAAAKRLGVSIDEYTQKSNQIVISGTAGYDFEHFAGYWKKYKAIIESGGDTDILEQHSLDGKLPNHKDFSIIRIPYDLIPEGFLDDKIISRAAATTHSGTFINEYGAVFSKDSKGFFKRTLIDSCVAHPRNMKKEGWPSYCPTVFDPKMRGDKNASYVMALDPASEVDNCALCILECYPEHARVVYSWTINKKAFRSLAKANLTTESDFYAYVARKIRELLGVFNCQHISIDAQGGGIAIMEALHNRNNLGSNEQPIWTIVNPDKPQDTDHEEGLHIIEPISFSDAKWVSEANHGLRFDMEAKTLLFPQFDQVALEIAFAKDMERINEHERLFPNVKSPYDTLEDCTFEIEELKDELTTICVTRVGAGSQTRDRWDTPEIKEPNGKKGRMKKDRYTALLMANMAARQARVSPSIPESSNIGGLLTNVMGKDDAMFSRIPSNLREGFENFYREL